MKIERTDRGFEVIPFTDRHGRACSLQQSSVIGEYEDVFDRPGSSAVWFGVADQRMEINRDRVRELVDHLSTWLETGSFGSAKEGT